MSDLDRYLTANLEGALDRFNDEMRRPGPASIEDIKRMYPATLDLVVSEWAASLDIRTNHELFKASIDAIH